MNTRAILEQCRYKCRNCGPIILNFIAWSGITHMKNQKIYVQASKVYVIDTVHCQNNNYVKYSLYFSFVNCCFFFYSILFNLYSQEQHKWSWILLLKYEPSVLYILVSVIWNTFIRSSWIFRVTLGRNVDCFNATWKAIL